MLGRGHFGKVEGAQGVPVEWEDGVWVSSWASLFPPQLSVWMEMVQKEKMLLSVKMQAMTPAGISANHQSWALRGSKTG